MQEAFAAAGGRQFRPSSALTPLSPANPAAEARLRVAPDQKTALSGKPELPLRRGRPFVAAISPVQEGTRALQAAAKASLSGQALDMATWMRRIETLTRAPVFSSRSRKVSGPALANLVPASAAVMRLCRTWAFE